MGKITKRYITLTLAILVIGLISGCAAGSQSANSRGQSASKKAVIQVVKPDGTTKGFSLSDLKTLPNGSLTVDGKQEEGPQLGEVLKSAGVTEYKQVLITGSSGSMTLAAKDVSPEVILDYTNRNTLKLAAPKIPKNQWLKDISSLKVE